MKKILPKLGTPKEKFVFISGIGCSSRFPYYLDCYGFHGIHGRAPAVASGVKIARPDLSVWVITGDGDGLSIGGNHLLHAIRRNLDINILLFNNQIYGLTKGQYSPTSPPGQKTKSSPAGSIDRPIRPLSFAIGVGATFVARSLDVDVKHLGMTLERAALHKGTSFVEIYQDCNVFNHMAFEHVADKQQRPDNVLYLEHGQPMTFGLERDKGVRMNTQMEMEVVALDGEATTDDLLVHNERSESPALAFLLSRMQRPNFPEPMGILRAVDRPCYEEATRKQLEDAIEAKGKGNLNDLYNEGETWTVN
jgi:2-oxoglutarate ferredoxin oxidoreductase subunit beta